MKNKFILITFLLVIAGCSQNVVEDGTGKENALAYRYYIKGEKEFAQANYSEAENSFKRAYDLYSLIPDIEGKIRSALFLTRSLKELGKNEKAETWKNKAYILIESENVLKDERYLLEAEEFFKEKQFRELLDYVKEIKDLIKTEEIYLQLSAYEIQAFYEVNSSMPDNLDIILDKANALEENDNPGIKESAALVYYYLGVATFLDENLTEAEKYFDKAIALYNTTNNYMGLADCMMFLGKVKLKIGDQVKSKALLINAADIYRAGNMTENLHRADSLYNLYFE